MATHTDRKATDTNRNGNGNTPEQNDKARADKLAAERAALDTQAAASRDSNEWEDVGAATQDVAKRDRAWKWSEDGDLIVGMLGALSQKRVASFDDPSVKVMRTIATIVVDGEKRTVWLPDTAKAILRRFVRRDVRIERTGSGEDTRYSYKAKPAASQTPRA